MQLETAKEVRCARYNLSQDPSQKIYRPIEADYHRDNKQRDYNLWLRYPG
jgi:hypothetical protein